MLVRKKKAKNKGGRKSKYDPKKHPKIVEELAAKGATNIEIAKRLGISKAVFYSWLKDFQDFQDSLKKGQETRNDERAAKSEKSLVKRIKLLARGYTYTETEEIVEVSNKSGIERVVSKRKVKRTKRAHPSLPAAIFLITNRYPDTWKNTQRIEHGGKVENINKNINMTPEEAYAKRDEVRTNIARTRGRKRPEDFEGTA